MAPGLKTSDLEVTAPYAVSLITQRGREGTVLCIKTALTNKPDENTNTECFHLHQRSRRVQLRQTSSRMVGARSWEREEKRELELNRYRASADGWW